MALRLRSDARLRRNVLRAGLIGLAVPNTVVGGWLLIAPRAFYDDFPGFGHHWVSTAGPYAEHPFTDFGGALLAIALATWLAAIWLERRLAQAALLAVLLEALPHFVYHLTTLSTLPTGEAIANQLALAYGVVLPLLLLPLTRKAR